MPKTTTLYLAEGFNLLPIIAQLAFSAAAVSLLIKLSNGVMKKISLQFQINVVQQEI